MYTYSSSIVVPPSTALAGFRSMAGQLTSTSGTLEVHSMGSDAFAGWELCAIDALYPGELASNNPKEGFRRIFMASHTHYAPMLDANKTALGIYSPETVDAFRAAIQSAPHQRVDPDRCTVYRGKVELPVYRRFDFPDSAVNRFLTRRAGLYPNDAQPIDRSVFIFVFSGRGSNLFSLVHHANHPVTRHDGAAASPDYVAALRSGAQQRFGVSHCLFMLGCAGDIRPNLAEKRTAWLPRSRVNWRFRSAPTLEEQHAIDEQYRSAVLDAKKIGSFAVSHESFEITNKQVPLRGGEMVEIPQLNIGNDISFSFLPYEVSHRYHLDLANSIGLPRRLIVSCADQFKGYLPHPGQICAGGYEVDGSRKFMGLDRQICLEQSDLW